MWAWLRAIWNFLCCCRRPAKKFNYPIALERSINWILDWGIHNLPVFAPEDREHYPMYQGRYNVMLSCSPTPDHLNLYVKNGTVYWPNTGLTWYYDSVLHIFHFILPFLETNMQELKIRHPIEIWNHIRCPHHMEVNGVTFDILDHAAYQNLLAGNNHHDAADVHLNEIAGADVGFTVNIQKNK